LSNKKFTTINIVDLEKLYNFVVENLLISIYLGLQNSIWIFFAERFFGTRQRSLFAECQKTLGKEASLPSAYKNTRQKGLCRVFFLALSKKASSPSVFLPCVFLAFGKEALCRVLERKHSAKYLTLDKDPDSGSENYLDLTLGFVNYTIINVKWVTPFVNFLSMDKVCY